MKAWAIGPNGKYRIVLSQIKQSKRSNVPPLILPHPQNSLPRNSKQSKQEPFFQCWGLWNRLQSLRWYHLVLLWSCKKSGIQHQVATVKIGETPSTAPYPPHLQLFTKCKMQPNLDLRYCVRDLSFNNVVIFTVKWHKLYISREDLVNLMSVN